MCFLPKSTIVSSHRRRRLFLPRRPPSESLPAPRPERTEPAGQTFADPAQASMQSARCETGQPSLGALAERVEQSGGHHEDP